MAKRSSGETDKILREAKKRFRRAQSYEALAQSHFRDDVKFCEGDAYNLYQWPQGIQNERDKRPMLTINRTRQHVLDILNDARQSRVNVKVRPVRGGASYEAAEILDGLIRHIEYISNADSAYQLGLKFAVQGGIGYWRIVTDYADDESFDQEIFIRPIDDPLSVYLDTDILQFDGSDAGWGFIFSKMSEAEFDRAYPNMKDEVKSSELQAGDSWVGDDGSVMICEYFRCVEHKDRLLAYQDPQTGQETTVRESEADKAMLASVIDNPATAIRSIVLTKVEHFKIVGDKIMEEKVWPGRYIPIIRVVGEETTIDGQMDRKGHTRALLDSQRMLNYNFSASVEYGALQTKTPWVGPMAAIENNQDDWNNANTQNKSFLAYLHIDDEGNPIPAPSRPDPPGVSPVFIQGARDALEQMYLASGQNQADFGQPGNERSGVAIEARQRQGDNATYHYLDHQATAIRLTGKMLIDLIPKVYDTARILKYRDDAGKEREVQIDPEAEQPFQVQENPRGVEEVILNPKLGTYDVQADVGPAYATQRQQAFNAFSELLRASPEMMQLVGDIWMRFADIPGANEAAERLHRMIPKQALEDGPDPQMQAMQQAMQGMEGALKEMQAKLADKAATHLNDQEKNAVAAYDSQTKRLAAIKDYLVTQPQMVMDFVAQVIAEAEATSGAGLAPALDPTSEIVAEEASPPVPPMAPPGPM